MRSAIINYIVSRQDSCSRYEIDKALLKSGFLPEEIEGGWQSLVPVPSIRYTFFSKPSFWFAVTTVEWFFLLWILVGMDFYGTGIHWLLNLLTIFALIGLRIFYTHYKHDIFIWLSMQLLSVIVFFYSLSLIFVLLLGDFSYGYGRTIHVSTVHNERLYYLTTVYSCSENPSEGCSMRQSVHRCELLNLVCPKIAKQARHYNNGYLRAGSSFSIDESSTPKKVYIYDSRADNAKEAIYTLTYP